MGRFSIVLLNFLDGLISARKFWSIPKTKFISGQVGLMPKFIGDKEKIQSINPKMIPVSFFKPQEHQSLIDINILKSPKEHTTWYSQNLGL